MGLVSPFLTEPLPLEGIMVGVRRVVSATLEPPYARINVLMVDSNPLGLRNLTSAASTDAGTFLIQPLRWRPTGTDAPSPSLPRCRKNLFTSAHPR